MSQLPINVGLAKQLHRTLGNWRLVGAAMAQIEGRPSAYQGDSVNRAVWRAARAAPVPSDAATAPPANPPAKP